MKKTFSVTVKAVWDDEAEVWVATSDDVPGLVVEAESSDDLETELKLLIPELLKLNSNNNRRREIPINLFQESKFTAKCA